jgi:hypothetical protein
LQQQQQEIILHHSSASRKSQVAKRKQATNRTKLTSNEGRSGDEQPVALIDEACNQHTQKEKICHHLSSKSR